MEKLDENQRASFKRLEHSSLLIFWNKKTKIKVKNIFNMRKIIKRN